MFSISRQLCFARFAKAGQDVEEGLEKNDEEKNDEKNKDKKMEEKKKVEKKDGGKEKKKEEPKATLKGKKKIFVRS